MTGSMRPRAGRTRRGCHAGPLDAPARHRTRYRESMFESLVITLREGVEPAIFLAAAGFNSEGMGRWLGAGAGLALAVTFGVLFVRGTIRIPLRTFFSVTSAVLLLIAAQLLVGGLHELSEAEILP